MQMDKLLSMASQKIA